MKKIIHILILLMPCMAEAQSYDALNISLYSRWDDPSIPDEPVYNIRYNSVWGYAQGQREYAIIGSTKGTHFIDVTNPSSPVQRDYVAGRRNQCIWREYKSYGQFLYAISDDNKPNSLQIIDMSPLPDSVHVVYDSDALFARAHTLFIDGKHLYCASVTTTNNTYYPMAVYDLSNPLLPVFLRSLSQDDNSVNQVHDMFVRNDTVYASAAFTGLKIYDFNSGAFVPKASILTYPDKGYNHSSALTKDGKTLVFTDEVPEDMAVKVADVSDFSNVSIASTFKSNPGATPHNPYIVGNDKLVLAYYMDGVQVYDIGNPSNPQRIGFFDTYPQNGSNYPNPAYAGCWGAYTDLPSGTLLASDMQNGLFVLDTRKVLAAPEKSRQETPSMYAYRHPDGDIITLAMNGCESIEGNVSITDMNGRIVHSLRASPNQQGKVSFAVPSICGGLYFVTFSNSKQSITAKLVIQ